MKIFKDWTEWFVMALLLALAVVTVGALMVIFDSTLDLAAKYDFDFITPGKTLIALGVIACVVIVVLTSIIADAEDKEHERQEKKRKTQNLRPTIMSDEERFRRNQMRVNDDHWLHDGAPRARGDGGGF